MSPSLIRVTRKTPDEIEAAGLSNLAAHLREAGIIAVLTLDSDAPAACQFHEFAGGGLRFVVGSRPLFRRYQRELRAAKGRP